VSRDRSRRWMARSRSSRCTAEREEGEREKEIRAEDLPTRYGWAARWLSSRTAHIVATGNYEK
jgi:hypothetical protein